MKKTLAVIFLLVTLVVGQLLNQTATCYAFSGSSMCVLEANSGKVFYSSNMNEHRAMASTTKIVTAITVLDHCENLDEIITVDDKAVGIRGTSIYLRYGEQISVKDLLYGLMLRSGNDAAMALAIHIGGGKESFANLMNETAKKCGANDSNFVNPHGLDEKGHFTTAYDLAKITAYALKNEIFKEIVSTINYQIPSTNISEIRFLKNKNRLLSSLDGCIGVKTGFTDNAGRCLVSATEREGMIVVCVVFNCGPMFEESVALLNRAYEDYENRLIIDAYTHLDSRPIFDSKQNLHYIFSKESFSYPCKRNEKSDIDLVYKLYDIELIKNDKEIGVLEIKKGNELLKEVKLYTINAINILDKKDILNSITKDWVE